MPSFVEQRPQQSGKMGFVYDISGEDIVSLATDIIAMADAPFVFQGKVGNQKHPLQQPEFIPTPLRQGGMVAGSVPFSGMSVNVYFMSLEELLVVPSDSDRMTADALIGADDDGGFMLPDGTYSDGYDQFDDVNDDGMGGFDASPAGMGMTDPRGRSAELVDRYGVSDEDEDFSHPYPPVTSDTDAQIMTKKDWFVTLLLLAIPVVNIVVMILWLVSKKTNPSKKNYLVIQLVFWIVSLLASLGLAVALVSSGLANGLFPLGDLATDKGENTPTNYYEGGYDPSVDGNDVASSEAAGMGAEDNEETDSGESDNVNASAEGANGTNLNGGSLNADGQAATGVSVEVDAISRQIAPDNRPVAIITMTVMNNTSSPATPFSLCDFAVEQGQNLLQFNTTPLDGFAPNTLDVPVEPGVSATFQISCFLVDDQDVSVTVNEKGTNKKLTHVIQAI